MSEIKLLWEFVFVQLPEDEEHISPILEYNNHFANKQSDTCMWVIYSKIHTNSISVRLVTTMDHLQVNTDENPVNWEKVMCVNWYMWRLANVSFDWSTSNHIMV